MRWKYDVKLNTLDTFWYDTVSLSMTNSNLQIAVFLNSHHGWLGQDVKINDDNRWSGPQSVLIEQVNIIGNDARKYDSDFFYQVSTATPFYIQRKPKGVFHICQQFFL